PNVSGRSNDKTGKHRPYGIPLAKRPVTVNT
ncbi:unnamed protein product, partial [marine sediment metagenome]